MGDRFSPSDISGLRRPKNVKFGTKAVSGDTEDDACTSMFGKKFLKCGRNCKNV